jgi:hypothetical protein
MKSWGLQVVNAEVALDINLGIYCAARRKYQAGQISISVYVGFS